MISAIAGALSIAGSVFGLVGQAKQASAAKKAERLREAQMRLEATRQRREQIRRAQVARSSALAAATNQGAGQSSALMGGMAQVQNDGGRNIVATNQDEAIGAGIFKANRQATTGQWYSSLGNGVANLGAAIGNNSDVITRLGASV